MFLTGNSSYYDQKMYGSQAPLDFKQLLEKERFGVHQALLHISQTLVSYLKEFRNTWFRRYLLCGNGYCSSAII